MKRMDKGLVAAAALLAATAAQATMERATPESQGVSSKAILAYIDACERNFPGGMHGFVIVRHGKVIAEGSWKPFDTLNVPHMLYSHSKSFTSTAVGFLVDEGKLDLDERVADVFADKVPADASENLRQLRVRDLLTMNVGTKATDRFNAVKAEDWQRAFLENSFDLPPGTAFRYDSSATYMLASLVERRSGRKLMDYLQEKLFGAIGIEKAWTRTCPAGVACGGWGMRMTTRELARFGQFYLQEGAWDGRQVLSRDWVRLATAKQTASGWGGPFDPNNEWMQGYGFQFWRCRHNAYRADGASGQISIIMPDQDMVVSAHAGLGDMQREYNDVWDCLLSAAKDAPLPEDPEAQAALARRIANLAIPPVKGVRAGVERFCGKTVALDGVPKLKSVRFDAKDGGVVCSLETAAGVSTFPIGFGEWKPGRIAVESEKGEFLGTLGEGPVSASAGVEPDGRFRVYVYLTSAVHHVEMTVAEKDGALVVDGELWGMGGGRFKSRQ